MLSDFRHDCLTSKTDRKGQTIQYVYDALNRLSHKGYPDTTGVDYIYDLAGKIRQVSDPSGTYGFAYDNMGRLIGTTTQYAFLPGVTYSNSYGYDAASNRTSFTAPDSSTVSYSYDTLSRLTNLTDSATGQFTFGYDILSRRTSLNRPNGVNTSYSYDSLSRLLSVLHQAGTVTLDGASYGYDNAGNRTSKTNDLNNVTENYTYDPIYQLTQVTQGLTTSESYSYDSVGNRLSSQGMSPYSYNSSNQLTSTPSANFTYDGNGNTSTKADASGTTTYTWDVENRLTSVTLPGTAGTVTFKYDPFGRRIQKSSPSGATIYLYDASNSVDELDQSGTEVAHYAQGAGVDEPLAALRSGTTGFYEQDGLGSVTSLTDSTGAVLNLYTYDSFGNLTASTGSFVNPYQFTGRDFDSETGLRYYRARYYDQRIGSFISEDPIGFDAGFNFYRYTDNSPVNYIDPWGTCIIYLFFESPTADKTGFFQHAFLVTWDNSHASANRVEEFRAGKDEYGGNLLSSFYGVMGGGPRAPIDDPKDVAYSTTLLSDKCSCDPYWQKLFQLNAFINSHNIPYHKASMNSNSVATTAIDAMGLKRPTLPFSPLRVPGWGNPLPGWPPHGGSGNMGNSGSKGCCDAR